MIERDKTSTLDLMSHQNLFVRQKFEMAEFIGFETRNRYEVKTESGELIAYAAEQQKGLLGFFLRQFLGHWRSFEISIFSVSRLLVLRAVHPFRFYFQALEVFSASGRKMGSLEQRFSIFSKRFDVRDAGGMTIMEVSSPIWRIWTFPFLRNGEKVAVVAKKWSGIFSEGFTDKDNFQVQYISQSLTNEQRQLLLAAAIFVDLQYFEKKA